MRTWTASKSGGQRKVGVVPITEHADALEFIALAVDISQRKVAALVPKLGYRQLFFLSSFVCFMIALSVGKP